MDIFTDSILALHSTRDGVIHALGPHDLSGAEAFCPASGPGCFRERIAGFEGLGCRVGWTSPLSPKHWPGREFSFGFRQIERLKQHNSSRVHFRHLVGA